MPGDCHRQPDGRREAFFRTRLWERAKREQADAPGREKNVRMKKEKRTGRKERGRGGGGEGEGNTKKYEP